MRLLRLDDLMTSYTNARPEAGLLVVDLDLVVPRLLPIRSFYVGQRLPRSSRLQLRCRGRITSHPESASGADSLICPSGSSGFTPWLYT